jgi:hypothetical protein
LQQEFPTIAEEIIEGTRTISNILVTVRGKGYEEDGGC